MRVRNEERWQRKKTELMELCYDCMAEHGLSSIGIRMLAEHCGCTSAVLYDYFENLDDLIVQATEHCMSKVEDDFMARAPQDAADLERFINEIPYWTAEKHGKKYRLMYQIYTHPKYIAYGKKFFEGVNRRYSAYAGQLEGKLGMPCSVITPFIFILVRAGVHYALFEDEYYLQSQLGVLKQSIAMFREKYTAELRRPIDENKLHA